MQMTEGRRDLFQTLRLRRPICVRFAKNTDRDSLANKSDICYCNRPRSEHPDGDESFDTPWTIETHTETIDADIHGRLINGADYLRCDIRTDPEMVCSVLLDVWKIDPPRLIVSILGGAKYFKLNERLHQTLMNEIIALASNPEYKSWILTNGYDAGVVQLVGQAVDNYHLSHVGRTITAIAISKYGCLGQIDRLKRVMKDKRAVDQYKLLGNMKKRAGEWTLELHHSHYIFLDDGTLHRYNLNNYRTRLTLALLEKPEHPSISGAVTIVIEGGIDTLRLIHYDLSHHLPVIIVECSGRVADYMARWYTLTRKMDEEKDPEWKVPLDLDDDEGGETLKKTHEKFRDKFSSYFDQMLEELTDLILRDRDEVRADALSKFRDQAKKSLWTVLYCLQPAVRRWITIFSPNDDETLSSKIFRSICFVREKKRQGKVPPTQQEQLLDIALAWDVLDVAKDQLIRNSLDNIPDHKYTFLRALTTNKPRFVHYFIKLGMRIDQIFYADQRSDELIQQLYKSDLLSVSGVSMLTHTSPPITDYQHLNRLLSRCIGDYMANFYPDRLVQRHNTRVTLAARVSPIHEEHIDEAEADEQWAKDAILRDLFLWSVLMNRIEMATVLLSHLKHRICAALIASQILKSYANLSSYDHIKEKYQHSADYFQTYAIQCLALCFANDATKTCQIILRSHPLYAQQSCLRIAIDADNKRFVGQPASVQALNQIWYDKLEPEEGFQRSSVTFVLSVLSLGLLAPFLMKYRPGVDPTPLPSLHANGINYCDPSQRSTTMNYPRRFLQFHQSLHAKFVYHLIEYFLFLLFFSYVMLFQFDPTIHWTEIVVIIFVSSMLIGEIRCFLVHDSSTFVGKIRIYFSSFFKQMNIIAFILFYLGLILRFQDPNKSDSFYAARILLAYDLELWWLCSLAFMNVLHALGPHLVAIKKMIRDLVFFMCLIILVMTAYGVASRSMAYYRAFAFDGRQIFRNIYYPVYYLMYGSLNNETTVLDTSPDAGWSIATHILLALHMLFINILLINLLIAMFNKRFNEVQEDTENIWHYQQYILIREYFLRSPAFLPFNLLGDLYDLCRLAYASIRRRCHPHYLSSHIRVFKMIPLDDTLEREWTDFEAASTYDYAQSMLDAEQFSAKPTLESKIRSNHHDRNELELLRDELSRVHQSLAQMNTTLLTLQQEQSSSMENSRKKH